ncbi:MAG: MnhB domain-containing protein [Spirochaetaceae bacterium]|nr:MnhB domain-containing protein [Spirochaetaceae bacterium]
MKKTEILDLISRKLAPFMFLFGFYLLFYGRLSPGGGFQGGVVISSGVILLSMSQGVAAAEELFPAKSLALVEFLMFFLLLCVGVVGMIFGVGFLGNPAVLAREPVLPRASFITMLNFLIGIKVGAGISLICIHLFRETT